MGVDLLQSAVVGDCGADRVAILACALIERDGDCVCGGSSLWVFRRARAERDPGVGGPLVHQICWSARCTLAEGQRDYGPLRSSVGGHSRGQSVGATVAPPILLEDRDHILWIGWIDSAIWRSLGVNIGPTGSGTDRTLCV